MNETTKRIVDELNALYARAANDYARIHDTMLKSGTNTREQIGECSAALVVADLLFSAKHSCNQIRESSK